MKPKFEVIFLEEAIEFIENLDDKTRKKIFFNIDKAKLINDPRLFKKLSGDIWELRTKYSGNEYRLLAFWDKTNKQASLVITSHGIIKKVNKMPQKEITKANKIREKYFSSIKN